jgi:S-adenosylmethionine synthetase
VTPRHPDKICDIISDSILDECLKQDPNSRVAIETMGGHNIITITGEMTTNAYVDIPEIVKNIIGEKYGIQTNIVKQSPEIAQGVDTGGAGDQGIMVGYACNENESFIPQELFLARDLCKFITKNMLRTEKHK